MTEDLLNVNVISSRETIAAFDEAQLLYLLVTVSPKKQSSQSFQPLNLSLIVDSSTSMKGERLRNVKRAASTIIEKVGPDDIISVISYNDRAEVVRPASPLKNKSTLVSQISSIKAAGGTEIFQGLESGYNEILKSRLDQYSNHMILLTDGHTYGDTKDCLDLARDAANQGIEISAFGIGDDWNEAFLDKLVGASGSQAVYIEDPSQVMDHLQEKISGLGVVYVSHLRLLHDFPPGVDLLAAFKIAPFTQYFAPDGLDIRLGSLETDVKLVLLLEFQLEVDGTTGLLQFPIKFLTDIPTRQTHDLPFDWKLSIPIKEEADLLDPPEQLTEAVRALNLYRMNERIWQDIEDGDIDLATRQLRQFSTRLLEAGQKDLAQQIDREAERLQSARNMPESSRKRLKYGTRSLLTQTVKLGS